MSSAEKSPKELARLRTNADVYPEDVARLRTVAISHGYDFTDEKLVEIWEEHSTTLCAGWLYLPTDDDELWEIMKSFI